MPGEENLPRPHRIDNARDFALSFNPGELGEAPPDSMSSDDIEQLMQEPPGGQNHGRQIIDLVSAFEEWDGIRKLHHYGLQRPSRSLEIDEHESRDDVNGIHPGDLHHHGMSAHRGVLQEEEFVHWGEVGAQVEEYFGLTLDAINKIYGSGRPAPWRSQYRDVMDGKLLDLKEAGGNMLLLAAVFGWKIKERGECRKMSKALARARRKRQNG